MVATGQPLASLYEGEVDEFAIFCPELGAVYVLPLEDIQAKRRGSLRVEPAKNNQAKGVRQAAAYEIARGKLLKPGRYEFPVVLVIGSAKSPHTRRRFSSIVVVNTGNNGWAVDKLP